MATPESAFRRTPIVTLMGPTASGKTELAMQLADLLPVEIISVDSAMMYRGMDIGTAKPPAAVLERYPHKLDRYEGSGAVVFGRRIRRRRESVCRCRAAAGRSAAARRRNDVVFQGLQGRACGITERFDRRAQRPRAVARGAKAFRRCTHNCSASTRLPRHESTRTIRNGCCAHSRCTRWPAGRSRSSGRSNSRAASPGSWAAGSWNWRSSRRANDSCAHRAPLHRDARCGPAR